MAKPIFLDPTGRRGRWTGRSLAALILLVLTAAAVLAFTIIEVPIPEPLPLRMDQAHHGLIDRIAGAGRRVAAALGHRWLPPSPRGASGRQVVSAFYVPWEEASRSSLVAHVNELDWVIPTAAFVTGPDHHFEARPDPAFDAIIASAQRRPLILPMVQNATNGRFDGAGITALLRDPRASAHLLDQLEQMVAMRHGAGIVFDFEEIPAAGQHDYLRFLAAANRRFDAHGWTISMAAPVGDPDWNLAAFAHVTDKVFLMLYDEHWSQGDAGPIASQAWYVRRLLDSVRAVGPDKAIATIANYGFDWAPGHDAEALTVEEAWLTAHDSEALPRFDPASGNLTFDYEEEDGQEHHVWFLDAATAWNQLRAAHILGVAGVSLWYMGSEDPGIWRDFASFQSGQLPDLATLTTPDNVDVQGSGEILRIVGTPTEGARGIVRDPQGLIRGEDYRTLPSPYAVRRTGYRPGLVSLTFDDGPDPEWTRQILDILRDRHVPATFFVVGENALAHPGLLNRIVQEGHELGNHSYTHPNFATISDNEALLEMNATERLVEAYTGRGMRLFRAPYFGDAEPTTGDELLPALIAQQNGYLNVGLHVDTEDWQQPGVDAIVRNAVNEVMAGNEERSGQIVLLHDGGGDRAQTVAALPRIIDILRARGFRFVPTAELAGLTDAQVMPRIEGADLLAVRADVAIFILLAGLSILLSALFTLAIILGILRSLGLTALALRGRSAEPPPAAPGALISVLIPAYNEARVIEASVRRVLASEHAALEVIVIDDGSSDGTSLIVGDAFAGEERVKLLTLANGGKARALNQGLKLARGAIVVALDADTQFEPETIARLARWFADPATGAVAGNAKVGNRVNLVTRWQAIEYVTAQNLERRALAGLGAIMVVPGAVGAWRRAALDAVGGFPVDTLAEDQDLTIAVQRAGWRVVNDPEAVAWTEAPQSFRALARQRFRWSFGTLQCLWKHRRALREARPRGLAWIGIPQAWLFQILFSLVSPMIDLALLFSIFMTWGRVQEHGWAQTHTDLGWMAAFWLLFVTVDLLCGWVAFRMDGRERRFPAFLLIAQRFVYRQLMYWVVIRAVSAALRGHLVGWGKLERTGRATAPATA